MFEKRFGRIMSVDEMQFGFMPWRGTIDAVFNLRMQKSIRLKEKRCICVLWTNRKVLT